MHVYGMHRQHVHITWLKAHTDSLADAGFSPHLILETSAPGYFTH